MMMDINKLSSRIIGMGWIFLLSGLSAESKKKITLCVLCDSAVNCYEILDFGFTGL